MYSDDHAAAEIPFLPCDGTDDGVARMTIALALAKTGVASATRASTRARAPRERRPVGRSRIANRARVARDARLDARDAWIPRP